MAKSFSKSDHHDFKMGDNFKRMQLDMFQELKRFDAQHKSDFPPLTEGLESFLTYKKVRIKVIFLTDNRMTSGKLAK